MAIVAGWNFPGTNFGVTNLLGQAQPVGTAAGGVGTLLPALTVPAEHLSHAPDIAFKAGLAAFGAAMTGLLIATVIYLWRILNPAEIKQTFAPLHKLLWNKWYFDELYWLVFVTPVMFLAKQFAAFDRGVIDSFLHGAAATAKGASRVVDVVGDRTLVDGSVNTFAHWTWDFGLLMRKLQTGALRQYVLFIVAGTVALFLAVTAVVFFA
jgi:NADH:ubiquinone oxidoreductase subunit 5 (subunit L)/multisubunit Na+/H+ antiporter MnhA subunit